MIDQDAFRREWAILTERYNRQPSPALAARYYQILSDQMDTDAFVGACLVVIGGDFFPSPRHIRDAARPDSETAALDQWELCERVMQGEHQVLERMSAEGQRVVQLLGGPRGLGNTPNESVPFVRREFLGLYRDVREGAEHTRILGPEVTPASRLITGQVMRKAAGDVAIPERVGILPKGGETKIGEAA